MNPDYKEKLRDLELTETQIESIVEINAEVISSSNGYASNDTDWHLYSYAKAIGVYADFQEFYLQSEGLIN